MDIELNTITEWLSISTNEPSSWVQYLLVPMVIFFAWLLNAQFFAQIGQSASPEEKVKWLFLKSFKRIVGPLIAMLMFLVSSLILTSLQLKSHIIEIFIYLSLSLAIIRLSVYLLRKTFKVTPAFKAWENLFVVIVWTIVALYLLGWLPAVIEALDKYGIHFGQHHISLLSVIKTVSSIAFFIIIALWVAAVIEGYLSRSDSVSNYLRIGITKSIRVILLIIAFLISLEVIGIDLTALTVLGGALGVGIGFGLQRIASNFISGFILLFDRSIRPGDVITIADSFGWIKELRARYVVIQDRDGVETLIPNENLITSEVINWSYSDSNVRVKIPVQVSYGDDPIKCMELMVDCAKVANRVLQDPQPVARLMGFGDNGINLELRLWINDPQNGVNNVRSELNVAIWKKFKEEGVTIPFPQRDLYLKHVPPDYSSSKD